MRSAGHDPRGFLIPRIVPEVSDGREGHPGTPRLKSTVLSVDHECVGTDAHLPVKAGPVPDRIAIWPVDDGRYGLDATFQGASGYERARYHEEELRRLGVKHSFRQELAGGWTLRFGPLRAMEIASALSAFVY